jgi:putative ABC transport system permease protein
MLQDLKYSVRMLVKTPAFTAVAIVALALGIGANSAIFSIVNAVLFRPLPFDEPDRLARVSERWPNGMLEAVPSTDYFAWRERQQSFDEIAAYGGDHFNLTGGATPERVPGSQISASLIPALGVAPILGRGFTDEEDRFGGNPVVILSYNLWQRRFAGDRDVIGKTATINDRAHEIVGVMPRSFRLPDPSDLYLPLALDIETESKGERVTLLEVVARLRAGVTMEAARSELTAITRSVAEQTPNPMGEGERSVTLVSLHEHIAGDVKTGLLVLLGAVGFVLLIACANVANLLLARAATRQKEFAIRSALGASRARLVRQLLTESLLLAVAGGALGILIALWGVDVLVSAAPAELADYARDAGSIGVDRSVVAFTFIVSTVTGILFGLVPAIRASRPDLNETLKEGGRMGVGTSGWRSLRGALVIAELALALVLLAGAGLMMKSFIRLSAVDPGFQPDRVITMRLVLPTPKYQERQKRIDFYGQVLERIRQTEGVESAGWTTNLPLSGNFAMMGGVSIEGRAPFDPQKDKPTPLGVVSPDYFRALSVPLRAGRFFTEQDSVAAAQPVALVNESFARRLFPGEDAVGRRIKVPVGGWSEIVGVVGDVYQLALDEELRPEVYVPLVRHPSTGMTLVARTTGDPEQMAAALRDQVLAVDEDQPVAAIRTMDEQVALAVAPRQFYMLLFTIFAALALALAAVGVYGVMSYSVAQRTHEIGIRMALGARQKDVLLMVIKQAAALSAAGVVIGATAGFALTRLMESLLFGVSATDPAIFILISLILTAVALADCALPARRAARVDPMVALRYE